MSSENLHPTQLRALSYLQRKASEAPFAPTLERLRRAIEAMDALLAAIGQAAARRRPGEGRRRGPTLRTGARIATPAPATGRER